MTATNINIKDFSPETTKNLTLFVFILLGFSYLRWIYIRLPGNIMYASNSNMGWGSPPLTDDGMLAYIMFSS